MMGRSVSIPVIQHKHKNAAQLGSNGTPDSAPKGRRLPESEVVTSAGGTAPDVAQFCGCIARCSSSILCHKSALQRVVGQLSDPVLQ